MRVCCGRRWGRCVLFVNILDSLMAPCLVYNIAMYTVYGRCGQYGRCMVHTLAGVASAWFIRTSKMCWQRSILGRNCQDTSALVRKCLLGTWRRQCRSVLVWYRSVLGPKHPVGTRLSIETNARANPNPNLKSPIECLSYNNNNNNTVFILVLLRYPKPTPKPRFFGKTVRRRNLGFSAVIDTFQAHLHAKIVVMLNFQQKVCDISGGETHVSSLVFYTVKYTGASDDSLTVPYFFNLSPCCWF